MKFKTLSNKEIRLDILPQKYALKSREQSKSNGQFLLGRMLRALYSSNAIILEEFPIPEENLWLDFYLPHHNLAFEFQGEQHDKFNKFFHGDKKGFEKSQERDQRKRLWCQLNGISLIEIREVLTMEELQDIIQSTRDHE